MTHSERRILDTFTADARARAMKLNDQGREIKAKWAGKQRPGGWDHYVLNDDHVAIPVGLGTWAVWMEREYAKGTTTVRRSEVGQHLIVTLFLGRNHAWWHEGARQIFETAVYDQTPPHPQSDLGRAILTERYATWEQAAAGHDVALELVKAYYGRPRVPDLLMIEREDGTFVRQRPSDE